ncbi:hypothetical protein TeGR_g7340, partial [Tetraparma gracilis]
MLSETSHPPLELAHLSPSLITSFPGPGRLPERSSPYLAPPPLAPGMRDLAPRAAKLLEEGRRGEAEALLLRAFRGAVDRDCREGGEVL